MSGRSKRAERRVGTRTAVACPAAYITVLPTPRVAADDAPLLIIVLPTPTAVVSELIKI